MTLADFIFIFLAAVTLGGAFFAVHLKNIFHNALFFGLSLLGVAGFFILLGSEFLALVEILIYVGAVLVAILFAIMISPALSKTQQKRSALKQGLAASVSLLLGGGLLVILYRFAPANWNTPIMLSEKTFDIQTLGKALLSQYALPFEIISVILLIAIIGSLLTAREVD